jgi:Rieske Fe-S protein
MKLDRRTLLKTLTAIPIIGGILAVLSPLVRFLKPNDGPFQADMTKNDTPSGGAQTVGTTTALEKPWDYFYFTYIQSYPQYDVEGSKKANIAGVAVKLPQKVKFVNTQGFVGFDGETDIALFQRICPHLGCIFNFIPDWHEVTAGYGGFVPPHPEQHSLMACPCHLSIYDPTYPDDPGNVISGPAPRGARYFHFKIDGSNIVVDGAESGGIAERPQPAAAARAEG